MNRISITMTVLSLLFTTTGCGAQMASDRAKSESPRFGKMKAASAEPGPGETWVINASMSVVVKSLEDTLAGLDSTLSQNKGAVTDSERRGRGDWATVQLTIRVEPDGLKPTMDWLRTQGTVSNERVEREEVSRKLLERDIALKTARATLARLETLLQKPDIKVEEILSIEKEMTRLRGEIETHEGEQRRMKDRVSLSTLVVELSQRQERRFEPDAKFYLSGRGQLLIHGGQETPGFGFSLYAPESTAEFHLDADFFPADGDQPERFLLTLGGSSYSDFFGHGERGFLNPYLGFRFGYANLSDHHFVFGAEFGLEVFKHRYLLVDARIQGLGVVGKSGLEWMGVAGMGLGIVY